MAKEPAAQTPQIEGNMLFYKKPELLNVQAHKGLGISPLKDQPFGFLRETQLVPITVSEFAMAGLNYPVIFAGPEKSPAVVMGMRENRNVFVGDDGRLPDGVYVPAFVRRYPFASVRNQNDPNNMLICIDRDAAMISDKPETPFFNGEEMSEMTNNAVELVKAFEEDAANSMAFVKMLEDLDLFAQQDVLVTPPGAPLTPENQQKMGNYMGISDVKLRNLSKDQLAELRDNGALAAVYAHFMSQLNWQRLFNMELMRDSQEMATAGQA